MVVGHSCNVLSAIYSHYATLTLGQLCHLLEARAQFKELGIYDDTNIKGTIEEKEAVIRRAIFDDFDLANVPFYSDCDLAERDAKRSDEENWAVRLYNKGVSEDDLSFLWCVLQPDPTKRPTVEQ